MYSGRDTQARIVDQHAPDLAHKMAIEAGLPAGKCRVLQTIAEQKENYTTHAQICKRAKVSVSYGYKAMSSGTAAGLLVRRRIPAGVVPPGGKYPSKCGNVARITVGRGLSAPKAREAIDRRRRVLFGKGKLQMPKPRRYPRKQSEADKAIEREERRLAGLEITSLDWTADWTTPTPTPAASPVPTASPPE